MGPSGPLYKSGCMAPKGEAGPIAGSTFGCTRGGIRRGEIHLLPCLEECGECGDSGALETLDSEAKLFCEGLEARKSATSAAT